MEATAGKPTVDRNEEPRLTLTDNVDRELMKFFKDNFKGEVKQKQRENELAAGIDRWGAQYEQSQKCIVM